MLLTPELHLRMLAKMSMLVQIESAIAALPTHEQLSLLTWLQGRLKDSPKSAIQTNTAGRLKVFRQLQAEAALTAEGAAAWKEAIRDAQR